MGTATYKSSRSITLPPPSLCYRAPVQAQHFIPTPSSHTADLPMMGYNTNSSNDYPTFFRLSGIALSRMIGFAAGAGFVSMPVAMTGMRLCAHRRLT